MPAVLFDLDGTLVNTAPDLIGALNDLRATQDLEALTDRELLPHVSDGSFGLVWNGMPPASDIDRNRWREEYLKIYAARLSQQSHLYAGIERVLDRLDVAGIPWGVVTNKPYAMAVQLLKDLKLMHRSGVVLGGDSLPQRKPDPTPVLEACRQLEVSPGETVFVGDDRRDVLAGVAAGTQTIAVSWGYLRSHERCEDWPCDEVIHTPEALERTLLRGYHDD